VTLIKGRPRFVRALPMLFVSHGVAPNSGPPYLRPTSRIPKCSSVRDTA
jgi:hypothetical protein